MAKRKREALATIDANERRTKARTPENADTSAQAPHTDEEDLDLDPGEFEDQLLTGLKAYYNIPDEVQEAIHINGVVTAVTT